MHARIVRFSLPFAVYTLIACPGVPVTDVAARLSPVTATRLERFTSVKQFDEYVATVQQVQPSGWGSPFGCAASSSAPMAAEQRAPDESITNTQEQGVDEGDIVKAAGDYLVVLRRGRLFSVRVGDVDAPELAAVGQINAWPDGYTQGTWYDEMLVSGDRVIVIGYSYAISATEVGLFRLAADGTLTHEGHFFLRSNDYYSSRNYASRLVGTKLLFYMPYGLISGGRASLPAMRRWRSGNALGEWSDILAKTEAYRPIQITSYPVLHTVVTCELAAQEPSCTARSVVGPGSRSFYVSREAVYLWVSAGYESWTDAEQGQSTSFVYRMPLEGGEVTAVRARGAPVDQFSFRERGGELTMALVASGGGDAMWHPEVASGDLMLARIPLERFAVEPAVLEADRYTRLGSAGAAWSVQNRFVGDWLLYGTGDGWLQSSSSARISGGQVFAVNTTAPTEVHAVPLGHLVDRLEPLGASAAAVIGQGAQGLGYSVLSLPDLVVADSFVETGAIQGETRSHGFFFKPDGEGGGMLGLPVRLSGGGWSHLRHGSARVTYLRLLPTLELSPQGALTASEGAAVEDQCEYSCADWYGNARPIFYRGRAFALLGYELVEGSFAKGVREVRRLEFLGR